jgi:hypothetical protein
MRRAHVSSIALALLALLPACDGCHGGKPYTPYTLTDTPPSASTAPSAAPPPPPADGGTFAAVPATPAPGDGTRWPLEGGAVEAPPGHAFAQGLVMDMDGDGKPDLLAFARAPDGLRGELWFASGKAPAEGRIVAALPADLAAPGCTAEAALSLIGPRTAALDFAPRCPARIREKAVRWIAAARFTSELPEITLEIRAGAPNEGETLQVALDGRDRDGDGRYDVAVTFTLASSASATASLAYFDRPAGLSRDPTEPEASFKALGAALIADGRKKTTAPRIPAAAYTARRLQAMLCEDAGGKPLITTNAGPIRCGDVHLAEESTIAEIEAALNLGDPVGAIAALDRLDALGARRKDVDTLVAKSIPSIAGTLVRATAAIPALETPPAFSPLAFEPDGSLLVHTKDGVVRADKTTFAETAVDPAPAWPKRLAWPASDAPSWTLTDVDECGGRSGPIAAFNKPDVLFHALPVQPYVRCASDISRPPVDMLGTTSQGLLFAFRGNVMAVAAQLPVRVSVADTFAAAPGAPVERGTARSPNGGTIALRVSRGVLVAVLKGTGRNASAKLWTTPLVDGANACVPSDGGERLACVTAKGAAIYEAR